jgi:transcriptional regulator with XRE-family HTH domain
MTTPIKLGSQLRAARTSRKMTQAAFGRLLSRSASSISQLERGDENVNLNDALRFSNQLQIHHLQLIFGMPTELCQCCDRLLSMSEQQRRKTLAVMRIGEQLLDVLSKP